MPYRKPSAPFLPLIALSLVSSQPALQAAAVTWDNEAATNLWTDSANWSDNATPSSGNTYTVGSPYQVQSVDAASSTFTGSSLTIDSGATLNLYRTNGGTLISVAHSIPSLSVNGGTILYNASVGSVTHNLNSALSLSGNVTAQSTSGSYVNTLSLNGGVTGSGNLLLNKTNTGTYHSRVVNFNSANTYTGNVQAAGVSGTNGWIQVATGNATGWGTGALRMDAYSRLDINTAVNQSTADLGITGNNNLVALGTGSTALNSLRYAGLYADPGTYTAAQLNDFFGVGSFSESGTVTISQSSSALPTTTWTGAGANQIWNTPENWSSSTAPVPASDYVVSGSGVTVRSMDAATSTFAGNTLVVQNGATLQLYRTNGSTLITSNHTLSGLTVKDASLRFDSSLGSVTHNMVNPTTFLGNVSVTSPSGGYSNSLTLNSLFGSGQTTLSRNTTGNSRTLNLNGTIAYTGDWTLTGAAAGEDRFFVNLNSADGWGSGEFDIGSWGVLAFATSVLQDDAKLSLLTGTNVTVDLGSGNSTLGRLEYLGLPALGTTFSAEQLNSYFGLSGVFVGTGTLTLLTPEPGKVLFAGFFAGLTLLQRRRAKA